jgi:large subunit ribosomal protein L13
MKTSTIPVSAPAWHVIDAEGQTLGKIAVKAAMLIRGKHKVTFSPHQLCGDHVIVVNAGKIKLPPKKGTRQMYYRHTGFVGNMKVTSLDEMLERKPTAAIELAVKGMLEENRLRQQMLKRLHVFASPDHPYAAQTPQTVSLSRTK